MKPLVIFIFILGGCIFLYNTSPENSGFFIKCPFYTVTGLYCPGCGSMRSCYNLLHGNFMKSVSFNPLVLLTLPYLIINYILFSFRNFTGRNTFKLFVKPSFIWGFLILVLAYWILRNIPIYPFNLLAPSA